MSVLYAELQKMKAEEPISKVIDFERAPEVQQINLEAMRGLTCAHFLRKIREFSSKFCRHGEMHTR
jgi:hypothetical protein